MIITMTAVVVVLLPSLNSNVNAVTIANNSIFSINVLDNWAYMETNLEGGAAVKLPNGAEANSAILLIPTEFSEFLNNINNGDAQKLFQNVGALSLMTLDSGYLFRNVPLEIYAQYQLNKSGGLERILSKENATIDGEKAMKFHTTFKGKSTNFDEGVGYYFFHDGNPYFIDYSANEKDFKRYLPQFEQMVKSFKFVK
jgi:hypothetical protein